MGEALISGAGGGTGKIYRWKRYEINEKTVYVWDKWSVLETTEYKWEKWDSITTYVWDKYNTKTVYDYKKNLANGDFTVQSGGFIIPASSYNMNDFTILDNEYFKIALNIAESNGIEYDVVNGMLVRTPGYVIRYPSYNSSGNYYFGNQLYHIIDGKYVEYVGNAYVYRLYHDYFYTIKENVVPNIIQGHVSSTNLNDYPNGGLHNDGYWYTNRTSSTSKGSTSYGQVTSTNSSAYPSNGASGSYWYVSAGSTTTTSKGSTSYGQVESESSSAYPNGGAQGGYWYENRNSRIEQSIGSYKDQVYSTARNTYPDNGIQGGYWYVFEEV